MIEKEISIPYLPALEAASACEDPSNPMFLGSAGPSFHTTCLVREEWEIEEILGKRDCEQGGGVEAPLLSAKLDLVRIWTTGQRLGCDEVDKLFFSRLFFPDD